MSGVARTEYTCLCVGYWPPSSFCNAGNELQPPRVALIFQYYNAAANTSKKTLDTYVELP